MPKTLTLCIKLLILSTQALVTIQSKFGSLMLFPRFSEAAVSCCWSLILNLACSWFQLAWGQEGTSQGS